MENLAADADEFTSNTYLVDNTALVDTGAADIVLERLEDKQVETVVITHSHHDHIEHLETIVSRFDPTVYAFEPVNLPVDAEKLSDGDTVTLGAANTPFIAIHTPGHKNDHVCLYSPDEHALFSGDLIFPDGAFGRTDLEEGDRDLLIDSIERITDLDVQAMYPGHDAPTTEDVNQQIQESLAEAKKREPKYE